MFKNICVIIATLLIVNDFSVARTSKQKTNKTNTVIAKQNGKHQKLPPRRSNKSNCKKNDPELLNFSHTAQAKQFREYCEQNPDVCKRFMRKLAKYITHKKIRQSREQKFESPNINTLQKMQIPSDKIDNITNMYQSNDTITDTSLSDKINKITDTSPNDWRDEIPANLKNTTSLSANNSYRLSHQNSADLRKELKIFRHKFKHISVKS